MAIGAITESCGNNRLFLRRVTPFLHAACGGFGEEPCLAQQRLDGVFHLISQAVDDTSHPFNTFRTACDFFKAIANRLFARNVGRSAQYGCKKTWRLARHIRRAVDIAFAKSETGPTRFWVDIDKTPVYFAPCGAVAQGGNRLIKRRIGQYRPVD